MLFVLYRCGKAFTKTGKVLSVAGFIAIIAYALNEGLRFGRGVDFNDYWQKYELLARGVDSTQNIAFLLFEKLMIELGLSWQCCIFVMSIMFIIGTFFLLKCYKEIAAATLPIFCLFSLYPVENMVRWYLAFSVFMIGLPFLLIDCRKSYVRYFFFSLFACLFHYAFIPIPILFLIISFLKKPIIHPFIIIPLYFSIGLLFQTESMLVFVDYVNLIGDMSEKFQSYGGNAEYWLTEGYSGRSTTAFSNMNELSLCFIVLVLGHKLVRGAEKKYIFAYNIFVIGFLIRPIANQIELVMRYDDVCFVFGSIIVAIIINELFVHRKVLVAPIIYFVTIIVFINYGRTYFTTPFKNNPQKYLYVWDSKGISAEKMLDMWSNESYKASKKND
jgi:hypothetical protein